MSNYREWATPKALSENTHQSLTQTKPPCPQPLKPISKDAIDYNHQVKARFHGQPEVWREYLDVMKDFRSHAMEIPDVVERVSELFDRHPDLIQRFNAWLPANHRMEDTLNSDQQLQSSATVLFAPEAEAKTDGNLDGTPLSPMSNLDLDEVRNEVETLSFSTVPQASTTNTHPTSASAKSHPPARPALEPQAPAYPLLDSIPDKSFRGLHLLFILYRTLAATLDNENNSPMFSHTFPDAVLLKRELREIIGALETRLTEDLGKWKGAEWREELDKTTTSGVKRSWGWDLCDFGNTLDDEIRSRRLENGKIRDKGKARRLGLCCGSMWEEDMMDEDWRRAQERAQKVEELVFIESCGEVLGCSGTGSGAGCRMQSITALSEPEAGEFDVEEGQSEGTRTLVLCSSDQPLSLVFSRYLVNTFIWLILLDQFFAPASTSDALLNRLNTFRHSWLGFAFTITAASLIPHATAPILRHFLSIPPISFNAECRSHRRTWSGILARSAVTFIAISCAMNAAASLGLLDDLVKTVMTRHSGEPEANMPSWAVQAGFLRGRFEWWTQKVADVSREWRIGECLWRMMEWVHESEILVDWM